MCDLCRSKKHSVSVPQHARQTGFHDQGVWVGHPWTPNFSLHLFGRLLNQTQNLGEKAPARIKCVAASPAIVSDMRYLDRLMTRLTKRRWRVAVFGLHEVYSLACAYSNLGNFPVVCGLDDDPDKPEYAALDFPILRLEDRLALCVQDVLLTMNKVHYEYAR